MVTSSAGAISERGRRFSADISANTPPKMTKRIWSRSVRRDGSNEPGLGRARRVFGEIFAFFRFRGALGACISGPRGPTRLGAVSFERSRPVLHSIKIWRRSEPPSASYGRLKPRAVGLPSFKQPPLAGGVPGRHGCLHDPAWSTQPRGSGGTSGAKGLLQPATWVLRVGERALLPGRSGGRLRGLASPRRNLAPGASSPGGGSGTPWRLGPRGSTPGSGLAPKPKSKTWGCTGAPGATGLLARPGEVAPTRAGGRFAPRPRLSAWSRDGPKTGLGGDVEG